MNENQKITTIQRISEVQERERIVDGDKVTTRYFVADFIRGVVNVMKVGEKTIRRVLGHPTSLTVFEQNGRWQYGLDPEFAAAVAEGAVDISSAFSIEQVATLPYAVPDGNGGTFLRDWRIVVVPEGKHASQMLGTDANGEKILLAAPASTPVGATSTEDLLDEALVGGDGAENAV